jgi:hypothetical protein
VALYYTAKRVQQIKEMSKEWFSLLIVILFSLLIDLKIKTSFQFIQIYHYVVIFQCCS